MSFTVRAAVSKIKNQSLALICSWSHGGKQILNRENVLTQGVNALREVTPGYGEDHSPGVMTGGRLEAGRAGSWGQLPP